ncbi:hypothetical protein EDD11_000333, partial [Mortierella claussenii]
MTLKQSYQVAEAESPLLTTERLREPVSVNSSSLIKSNDNNSTGSGGLHPHPRHSQERCHHSSKHFQHGFNCEGILMASSTEPSALARRQVLSKELMPRLDLETGTEKQLQQQCRAHVHDREPEKRLEEQHDAMHHHFSHGQYFESDTPEQPIQKILRVLPVSQIGNERLGSHVQMPLEGLSMDTVNATTAAAEGDEAQARVLENARKTRLEAVQCYQDAERRLRRAKEREEAIQFEHEMRALRGPHHVARPGSSTGCGSYADLFSRESSQTPTTPQRPSIGSQQECLHVHQTERQDQQQQYQIQCRPLSQEQTQVPQMLQEAPHTSVPPIPAHDFIQSSSNRSPSQNSVQQAFGPALIRRQCFDVPRPSLLSDGIKKREPSFLMPQSTTTTSNACHVIYATPQDFDADDRVKVPSQWPASLACDDVKKDDYETKVNFYLNNDVRDHLQKYTGCHQDVNIPVTKPSGSGKRKASPGLEDGRVYHYIEGTDPGPASSSVLPSASGGPTFTGRQSTTKKCRGQGPEFAINPFRSEQASSPTSPILPSMLNGINAPEGKEHKNYLDIESKNCKNCKNCTTSSSVNLACHGFSIEPDSTSRRTRNCPSDPASLSGSASSSTCYPGRSCAASSTSHSKPSHPLEQDDTTPLAAILSGISNTITRQYEDNDRNHSNAFAPIVFYTHIRHVGRMSNIHYHYPAVHELRSPTTIPLTGPQELVSEREQDREHQEHDGLRQAKEDQYFDNKR